jgi:hypothetical protein
VRQGERVRIDIGRDRDGEFFDVRCQDGITPEILGVRPASRHLVLMVRDGSEVMSVTGSPSFLTSSGGSRGARSVEGAMYRFYRSDIRLVFGQY